MILNSVRCRTQVVKDYGEIVWRGIVNTIGEEIIFLVKKTDVGRDKDGKD